MATQEQKNVLDENIAEQPLAESMFSQQPSSPGDSLAPGADEEQLSAHDIFAGDEDFYKLLEDYAEDSAADPALAVQAPKDAVRPRRLSSVQKVLVLSIVGVASMLVYTLVTSPSERPDSPASTPVENVTTTPQQQIPSAPPVTEPVETEPEQSEQAQPVVSPVQSVSLEVARNFYLQGDYEKASAAYEQLREALPAHEELLRDFLRLRVAVCSLKVGDLEQASRLLVTISRSPSPAVRTVANFRLSLLEMRRRRYLRARTRAHNALALIKAVDFDDDWVLAMECDCHFLIAECLTRHVLSLSHAESDLPEDLSAGYTASLDPFTGLNEEQLRRAISSGSEHLGKGLLGPRIRKLAYPSRWAVTSYGAPIEELLARFAASAELDIHWAFDGPSDLDSEDALRQRPVSLYLPAATSRQIVLAAAGTVGLLAHPENDPGEEKVTIYDPATYTSLREQIVFLSQHAISLWQKFVLTFYSDRRLGNAHFMMGLLQSQAARPTEAIAEYKLVANRFSQTQLAPFALFHSSKVKSSLRDYPGAREDLKQLVEQYDDCDIYGQAYLRLADATMKSGLKAEAALVYKRVYNFGLSKESKIDAAIGAAKCFYETQAYEDAAQWLNRYIDLARAEENDNLYSAHFMLGQTNLALGKYEEACSAFEYALGEHSSRQQYVEAITALVKGHIEQEQFVEALDVLENVRSVALSKEQSVDMLLLRSKIYRLLGLADTAIVSLRDRGEYVSDVELAARIAFELAQCDIVKGNLDDARRHLSEILGVIGPGSLAEQTALELADVCVKLERSSQAVSVCLQLLNSNLSPQDRREALRLLAAAYNLQKDYDKAALALSGQWKQE
ncbi:MAG: tetratricopeptide repeat protein [Planctomycetota bacterium]|jgi:tetratricopeptide (TPR) repeat protein